MSTPTPISVDAPVQMDITLKDVFLDHITLSYGEVERLAPYGYGSNKRVMVWLNCGGVSDFKAEVPLEDARRIHAAQLELKRQRGIAWAAEMAEAEKAAIAKAAVA